MTKYTIPSKSERDDGGDQPIGVLGLLFGAVIWGALIYEFIVTNI